MGFDVNCIYPKTRIQLENGSWITIKELEKHWNKLNIDFFNKDTKDKKQTNILIHMKRKENNFLYHITTKIGRKIKVTGDHPILTKKGMINAVNLSNENNILMHSFKGVKFKKPSSEIILSKKKFEKILDSLGKTNKGNSRDQIIRFLNKKKLLPLKYDSPQLPILIRLIGFILGDGVISLVKEKTGYTHFYGKKEDLEIIKKDLEKIGIKISRVNERLRHHIIKTRYGTSDFEYNECCIIKKCTALACLLIALGSPYGRKTEKTYRVPHWLLKAPLWQKRLFLASFFGAELSKPTPYTKRQYNFYEPQLNMNKSRKLKNNGIDFLNDIRLMLGEFGVKSRFPVLVRGNNYKGKISDTIGLRLCIYGNPSNLIKLFEKINYEYNSEKSKLASLAANYLRLKENIKDIRNKTREQAIEMYKTGIQPKEIVEELKSYYTPKQFISHSIYTKYKTKSRISFKFISFQEYIKKYAYGNDGFVWDEIEKIEIKPYKGLVYDITINDINHNFIANNFVVSNCGVTTVKTNLSLKMVQPKIKKLIDTLFNIVPAGLGSRGEIELPGNKINDVLVDGAEWVVNNGYGNKEDLDFIEENGKVEGAKPENVSDLAIRREKRQVGTLGSGNHYLEVQAVDKIFDKNIAEAFDLEENQIIVSIHCGSRALGHQIGTDYLKILAEASRKYNIPIRERELVCAPIESDEGKRYISAVNCAINYAFANRQMIVHFARKAFKKIFKESELTMLYNIGHNTVKKENHKIDNKIKELYIHRKGATRAFGPEREELPKPYQGVGQPVIIGGTMGTSSYILVGTEEGEEKAFGSAAHGAGRTMSRTQAKRTWRGDKLIDTLAAQGIYIKAHSFPGLAEEAPGSYKDVTDVIDAIDQAELAKKVVRMKPIGNIKG